MNARKGETAKRVGTVESPRRTSGARLYAEAKDRNVIEVYASRVSGKTLKGRSEANRMLAGAREERNGTQAISRFRFTRGLQRLGAS